ncbi:MAG: zinc-dependent alcohol dehydrogenase family protein [Thiohalospira sp.]
MKAVRIHEPGGPEQLRYEEVPEPAIERPGQVKVAIRAAGVNPVDTKVRAKGPMFAGGLPFIPGCDAAGEIVEVGEGVTDRAVGERVFFCYGGLGGAPGTYAEYAVVDAERARPLPDAVDFATAAAAPLVSITAWESLFDRARLQSGQSLLVHAGAGGVGHVALQMARLQGARIATTVGSRDRIGFVGGLGAEEIIVYTERDFVDATLAWTDGRGVDVALDTVGGATWRRTVEAVAHYGDLVTLLNPGEVDLTEARTRNLRLSFELMLTPQLRGLGEALAHQGTILDQCARWLESGDLRVEVAETLALEQVVEAHRRLEAGGMQGKVVLRP